MTKITRTACVISVILFISLFTLPSAFPQIYRWTDKKGTIHFSDNPSSLPEDYSVHKSRNTEKNDTEEKDTEKKSPARDEKSNSGKKSIKQSDKSQLEKKPITPLQKPEPAEKRDEPPVQPAEPVKPVDQGTVIVQIKPTEENASKQGTPGEPAPTQPAPKKFDIGKKPGSPSAFPGDAVNMVRMKPTMMVGAIVGILGFILSVVGGIWFLVAAFKVNIKWGLLCLFLAPAQLVFLFKHWKEARKPFAVGLIAMGAIFAGIFLMVENPLQFLQQYNQFR